MNEDDPLERAIADWQRKHHIADGDPMIAALELVRVYLQHARHTDGSPDFAIPSFEDFRGTIELLDRRSKSFINQASDLVGRAAPLWAERRTPEPRPLRYRSRGGHAGNRGRGAHRPFFMSMNIGYAAAGILWLAAVAVLISHMARQRKHRAVVRLAGFKWTRADFCRGWLITGDTGSGKTRSGITPLLFQVFRNEPTWGGLCIDDKGVYWETLSEMARHFGREDDLILLQVRPEDASSSLATEAHLQSHFRPQHSVQHFRQSCRGYGGVARPGG